MSAELVERALGLSTADGCLVIAQETHGVNLRWANNTLTTNGIGSGRSLTVISVVGESVGVRSASVTDDLAGLVRASEQAAREAGPAEDFGPLVEGDAAADFAQPAGEVGPEILSGFARDLGESFAAARSGEVSLFGFAAHDVTTTWLGSSTGLRLRHAQPEGSVQLNGRTALPGGSSWVGQSTRDWSDVVVADLDAEVQRRLGWASRRVELPAGRYETLLPPSCVADLMVYLYWSSAGRDAAEGHTVFSRAGGGTRVGESFGPAGLRLFSDPHDAAQPTAPFAVANASSSRASVFDNGLALPRTDWLSDGSLAALIQTRSSARKTGSPVTPYVPNLTLEADGGAGTADDLVARTGRGLLLTCLWYIREVDPQTLLLTGLTRDGVYLVEGGEVVGVVNNFRFNDSPVDLLGRIAEVGATQPCLPREWGDYFSQTRMPALRVDGFNMSSVSQAS